MAGPARAAATGSRLRRMARLLPAVLRENRPFRRFWTGRAISLFGDQVSLLALPLVAVLILHASAAQMGYLAALELAPNLLSLHAGALVDRLGHRRQLMIGADAGRALLLASVPTAYALGTLTWAHLAVVGCLLGALNVLFMVSGSTLFVSLVPRERYVEAQSLLNGSRAFSFVGGPSAGGALVQAFSAPLALVVDAVSYVASALSLAVIHPVEPAGDARGRGLVTSGMRFILRSPIVRSSLAATATINAFNFIFNALFILYATRTLGLAAGTLGLVIGAGAVGALIGSVLTGPLSRRIGLGPAFVLGSVLFPAPLVLVALAGGPTPVVLALLFLAVFGAGLGVMVLDISIGSILAGLVPAPLRARVSGAYMVVNYGVRPLGALAGGALGTAIGLRPTLWIATLGGLLGVLWLIPSPLPRLRALPTGEPA